MPNLEKLTDDLWAGWSNDNARTGNLVLVGTRTPGNGDPSVELVVQADMVPDLVAFLARADHAVPLPTRTVTEVSPGVVTPPSDPTLAERTMVALQAAHDHPGPFQTEAVLRLLHQRATSLEARTDAEANHAVADSNHVSTLSAQVNGLAGRVAKLEGEIEGENGLTQTVSEAVVAVDALQAHVGELQQQVVSAFTPTPRSEEETVTRTWVKDEIGQAVRRHAGAMHEVITRTAQQIVAFVVDATKPRPGLVRRLAAAAFAASAPRPAAAPPVAPAPSGIAAP